MPDQLHTSPPQDPNPSSFGRADGPPDPGRTSSSAHAELLIISAFQSERDNTPTRVETSWEELCENLMTARSAACTLATCVRGQCPHKKIMAWSPACWPAGATREKHSVEAVCALVVDLDHVPPQELEEHLARVADFRYILHSSHSDRPDDRCVRLVFALSHPVAGADFARFWPAAIAELGPPADERAKDASRLYYLPSRPSDACGDVYDGSGFDCAENDGVPLDVDVMLARAPELPVHASSHVPVAHFAGRPSPEAWGQAVQILVVAWPTSKRHHSQLALAGALIRSGWPVELVAEFCADVAEAQEPGNADYEKRLTAARSSAEKFAAGEAVTGWPTVIDCVGKDVVDQVTKLLGVGVHPDPEFAAAMSAPTASCIRTCLSAARDKLKRSTDAAKREAGLLLGRVLKVGEVAANDAELARAALAVVQAVPDATTPAQISDVLRRFAGERAPDLDEIIGRALKRRNAPTPEGEFVIDERTHKPRASQQNLDIALGKLGVTLSYDQLAEHESIKCDGQCDRIEDKHCNRLFFEIEARFGFRPDEGYFNRYLSDRAHAHEYHPVRDYLASVEPTWDGVPRIDTWLINLAGAKDTPFVRAVSRLVLVAACRRVRHPGAKFDELLVLESPQGTDKSSALATLCPLPGWFGDDMPLGADTQRRMEAIEGKWIMECGELKGMRTADHLDLKAFLSRTTDECRMSYARRKAVRPRQCIFIGTTNDREYLKDQTGNRRYWPVEICRFDLVKLREQRDQLWAEAAHAEAAGESIRLADALWSDAATEQEQRRPMSVIEERLRIAFDGAPDGKIRAGDVRALAGFGPGCREPNSTESSQINAVMRSLGWRRSESALRWGADKKRAYSYVRGDGALHLAKNGDAVVTVHTPSDAVVPADAPEGVGAKSV